MLCAVSAVRGNLALNEGLNELWTILCSAASGTKFDNTNAELGIGDSDTAASATQTDLQAAVNYFWQGMDAGYPTYGTDQKAVWMATIGASDANYAWKEFSVRNGSSANKNLNRKISDQGTKTNGQVWELTLTITAS